MSYDDSWGCRFVRHVLTSYFFGVSASCSLHAPVLASHRRVANHRDASPIWSACTNNGKASGSSYFSKAREGAAHLYVGSAERGPNSERAYFLAGGGGLGNNPPLVKETKLVINAFGDDGQEFGVSSSAGAGPFACCRCAWRHPRCVVSSPASSSASSPPAGDPTFRCDTCFLSFHPSCDGKKAARRSVFSPSSAVTPGATETTGATGGNSGEFPSTCSECSEAKVQSNRGAKQAGKYGYPGETAAKKSKPVASSKACMSGWLNGQVSKATPPLPLPLSSVFPNDSDSNGRATSAAVVPVALSSSANDDVHSDGIPALSVALCSDDATDRGDDSDLKRSAINTSDDQPTKRRKEEPKEPMPTWLEAGVDDLLTTVTESGEREEGFTFSAFMTRLADQSFAAHGATAEAEIRKFKQAIKLKVKDNNENRPNDTAESSSVKDNIEHRRDDGEALKLVLKRSLNAGPDLPREIPLYLGLNVLGRKKILENHSHIIMPNENHRHRDKVVSREHVSFSVRENGECELVAKGSAITTLNGLLIEKGSTHMISPGAKIGLCDSHFGIEYSLQTNAFIARRSMRLPQQRRSVSQLHDGASAPSAPL